MKINSAVKSQVKEWFVVRLVSTEGKHDYLNIKHHLGYRFTGSDKDILDVVSQIVANKPGPKKDGLNEICRFKTEAEAREILVKIFNQYYSMHGEELSAKRIEIANIRVTVEDLVISNYNIDDVLGLNEEGAMRMDEFEHYLVDTHFGKTSGFNVVGLRKQRKSNLTGYNLVRVDELFKGWRLLNGK